MKTKISVKSSEAKGNSAVFRVRKADFNSPVRSPVDHIFFLQRTIGNQAVQRLFKFGVIQTKLKIGQPNDIYEQEADRVAEQVMSMSEPQVRLQPLEEEEEEIQTKSADGVHAQRQEDEEPDDEEEFILAKQAIEKTPLVNNSVEAKIHSVKVGGQPLPKSMRNFFESRFGHDFSSVCIHNNSQAADTARMLNAQAFTMGRDIVFGAGQYEPETTKGKKLLAHELTHVVQQAEKIGRTALQFKRKDEEKVFDLVNEKRGENLKWSDKLYAAATKHSEWMRRNKKLVHTEKLVVKGYDLVGENIGAGQGKNSEVVEDWWNSPLHKANIGRPEFEEAAVGIAGKGSGRYFTQQFGAINPKTDFWLDSSRQKGEEWTHIVKGVVSDNIDSADELSISIEKVKGLFKSLPETVEPDLDGAVSIRIVTEGMETAEIRIKVTDGHGNGVKTIVSL